MTIGILNEVMESNLATKQDVKDLRSEIQLLMAQQTIRLGTIVIGAITVWAS